MEIWDIYDKNRRPTGQTILRGEEIPAGGYHLVVHAWIRNSRGEFLISQRSASRPTFPLMWECAGGSAVSGEDSLTAVLREVREEVGLTLPPDSGRIIYSVVGRKHEGRRFSDILDVWLFDYDGEVDLTLATTDEAAQVCWADAEQIRKLFDSHKMVATLNYFFDILQPY